MEALTTSELLDALTSGVGALADRIRALSAEVEAAKRAAPSVQQPSAAGDVHCSFPALQPGSLTPDALRVQMDYAGLTKTKFAEVFGIPLELVQDWLSGQRSVPAWVLPSVHIFELLTPSERRRFTSAPAARSGRNPAKVHPFARIEEL
jgi:hypothetical protein